MNSPTPFGILNVGNVVGECIVWDWRRADLWWTDIQRSCLHRYDWESATVQNLPAPDRIGSFGLVVGSDRFITAFAHGIALYEPYGQAVDWIADSPAMSPGIRFNDGRVDRRGRFWTGTMVEDEQANARGSLYSVDAAREVSCHLQGLSISNGLCFSPDGTRMYFADSPTRTLWEYEVLEPEGKLQAPRVFATTPDGAFPDGATVDVDGCIWSAHWGAGRIVRYSPDGRVDRTIQIPTCQPSCACFAGADLDILCITSANEGLSAATLAAEPNAGDVFLYRTNTQGLPESEYRHE